VIVVGLEVDQAGAAEVPNHAKANQTGAYDSIEHTIAKDAKHRRTCVIIAPFGRSEPTSIDIG
jgi:hypothetical protein